MPIHIASAYSLICLVCSAEIHLAQLKADFNQEYPSLQNPGGVIRQQRYLFSELVDQIDSEQVVVVLIPEGRVVGAHVCQAIPFKLQFRAWIVK